MHRTLFLTTLLAGLSGSGFSQASFLEDFQQKWKNACAYTLETAKLMPEEAFDFRPADDTRSFREQLLHMLQNMHWLATSHLGGPGMEQDLKRTDYPKEELLTLMQATFDYTAQVIAGLEKENLDEPVEFFTSELRNKGQILILMNDHLTHHRGQAIVYLRLNGIKPPRYRGW